jgi:hypothetical protein
MKHLIETIKTGELRRINDVASAKFDSNINVMKFLNESMLEDVGTPSIQRHIETTQQIIKGSVSHDNAVALAEDLNIIYGSKDHV